MNARAFHILMGFAAAVVYVYVLLHLDEMFPKLAAVKEARAAREPGGPLSTDALFGYRLVLLFPAIGIACLLLPEEFISNLSPRVGLFQRPLVTPGFVYLAGYFFLALSVGLFLLFRQYEGGSAVCASWVRKAWLKG